MIFSDSNFNEGETRDIESKKCWETYLSDFKRQYDRGTINAFFKRMKFKKRERISLMPR
jgi:hypothetical protein